MKVRIPRLVRFHDPVKRGGRQVVADRVTKRIPRGFEKVKGVLDCDAPSSLAMGFLSVFVGAVIGSERHKGNRAGIRFVPGFELIRPSNHSFAVGYRETVDVRGSLFMVSPFVIIVIISSTEEAEREFFSFTEVREESPNLPGIPAEVLVSVYLVVDVREVHFFTSSHEMFSDLLYMSLEGSGAAPRSPSCEPHSPSFPPEALMDATGSHQVREGGCPCSRIVREKR